MMKRILTVIELLFLVVAILAAGYIGFYIYQTRTARADFAELANSIPKDVEEEYEGGFIKAYKELYDKNNDFKGWLKIPGTSINYPVVQAKDNDFYMHRNFNMKYQYCGIPFMDYQCTINPESTNLIIYAHNMKDGSMFAPLLKYKDKEYYKEHNRIIFNSIYKKAEYDIVSVMQVKADDFPYHTFINSDNEREFNSFINDIKGLSLYNTNTDVKFSDKLLTLSTCSYNVKNERMVIIAKRVK